MSSPLSSCGVSVKAVSVCVCVFSLPLNKTTDVFTYQCLRPVPCRYITYVLTDLWGNEVVRGRKQGFCLVDSMRYTKYQYVPTPARALARHQRAHQITLPSLIPNPQR